MLATGAQPVRLGLPGEDLEGVYYLRTVDDAERLRAAISRAENMVIVGGGFIGAEVAASATQMDTRVTLLEMADTLWTRAVGSEMGRFFEDFLRDRGVHIRTRTRAAGLEGGDTVEAVVLPDGTRLHADLVVIGVGVRPDTGLAEEAGLPVDDGVLVDQQLRAAEGVFAAGDVANAEHPLFGRIRIEHWAEALNQGLLAGRNLAGAGERYDRVPYFFSDQFDLSLSYLGHVREWDELVVRGSREVKEPKFVAWYLREGTPRAALIVNDWDAEDPVREVIRRGPVDPEERHSVAHHIKAPRHPGGQDSARGRRGHSTPFSRTVLCQEGTTALLRARSPHRRTRCPGRRRLLLRRPVAPCLPVASWRPWTTTLIGGPGSGARAAGRLRRLERRR